MEIWSEALAIAQTIRPFPRDFYLHDLALHLPVDFLSEALDIALDTVRSGYCMAASLTGLAPRLSPQLLSHALAEALSMEGAGKRVFALTALLPSLSPDLRFQALDAALTAAYSVGSAEDRADVFRLLAPHVPPDLLPNILKNALIAVEAIKYDTIGRRGWLIDLLPELLAKAPQAVLTFAKDSPRILSSLAPHLPQDLVPQAFTATRKIADQQSWGEVLKALAPRLSPELLSQAFTDALAFEDDEDCVRALKVLAPHLPPDLLCTAFANVVKIDSEHTRAFAFEAVTSSFLSPELLSQAFTDALAFEDDEDCVRALTALAPYLPVDLRSQACQHALRLIQLTSSQVNYFGDVDSNHLVALAPHIPPDLLPQAIDAVQSMVNLHDQANVLVAVSSKLSSDLIRRALDITQSMPVDVKVCAKVLMALAPRLSPDLVPGALVVARSTWESPDRPDALTSLASHMPEASRPEMLRAALADALTIADADARADALIALASHPPVAECPQLVRIAFTAALTIEGESASTRIFKALIRGLGSSGT